MLISHACSAILNNNNNTDTISKKISYYKQYICKLIDGVCVCVFQAEDNWYKSDKEKLAFTRIRGGRLWSLIDILF